MIDFAPSAGKHRVLRDGSLQLRVVVVDCVSGHIGYYAALKLLQQRLHWKGMEADLKNLCNSCLHCLPTRIGFRKPRLWVKRVTGRDPIR